MLKKLFLVFLLLLLVLQTNSNAETTAITNGLNWLKSSQDVTGSWNSGQSSSTDYYTTAAVLETFAALGDTSGALTNGLNWLSNEKAESTTYLAPKIKIVAAAGGDPTTDTDTLHSYKDSASSWGGYLNQASSNFHTSLALQAIKAANYPDSSVINPALAYLTTSQNPDGGWGFYKGDASNVYMTAVVSATLQQFPQMTTIATAVNKATSYLIAHQNPDGGFGTTSTGSGQDSPSAVYETALAYAALVAVSTNEAALVNAINYLTAAQSANGSWNDNPYSTALVLKALYLSENRPSPPPPPPAAGRFSGTVVDATTRQGVVGVAVVLESNQLINTTTDAAGSFTLADVPPGSQKVAFSLSGYAPTSVDATSVADSTVSLGTVPMLSSYSTGTIAGTVTDPSGKPLADVAISVAGAWSGSATTGADGSFSFSYVIPGNVTITASKSGFQTVSGTGTVYARTTLSFSPRMSATSSQATTGTLVGRVIGDYWGLPIDHLPGEKGVTVTLSGGVSAEPDPNNGGYFTIQGLAPNTYQVTVGMNGYASQTFRVVIMPGVTTDLGTIRLVMDFTMTLTGRVTDAATGTPIPGAEVTVVGSSLTGRTDFGGTYAIADIPQPGEYTLKASAAGYTGKSYTIGSSPWTQTMDVTLAPLVTKGSITGTVVDASSNQPLNGVILALAGDPSVSATTNSTGAFILNAVPKGLQQITLSLNGYAQRTLTTAIAAGAVNNVGTIVLSVTQMAASIQGKVWDADANAPFAGVEIQATGTDPMQTVTAADGTYKLDDVTPGTVTVAANAVSKPGYYSARFTGTLAPGGVLVFSPALSTAPLATVDVTVQTDKAVYKKGETAGISLTLRNRQATECPALLHVRVTDSSGASIYDTNMDVNLAADGVVGRELSFVLPINASANVYKVLAEVYDESGTMTGAALSNFGLAVSRISVTPALPAVFSVGANTVSFSLANTGDIAVSAGSLGVTLKDPDGMVVSTAAQAFALGLGESRTLTCTISVPPLKFGTYTLSYIQSDETKAGGATLISLPNSVAVTGLYDNASHRIRETANLTITVRNTGRFNLDSTGAGITVTAAVPDAAYAETKTLYSAPAVGDVAGSTLLYHFIIPETITAGQHGTRMTVALQSGSTTSQIAQLAILESSLSLSPIQAAYNAGETIYPMIMNSGGVDTQVQYRLSLYDAKAALIAEKSGTETAVVGAPLNLSLAIPAGAVDGSYSVAVQFKDLKTGKEDIVPNLLAVGGVKGLLQVRTDKDIYLSTENITGLSTVTNSGVPLQGGNLHMQVTASADTRIQKTWSTQADFQTGVRNGVDTFETPDNVTLLPFSDNFNDGIFNTDRWRNVGYPDVLPITEINGVLRLYIPANNPTWRAIWLNAPQLAGDFDAMVDYSMTGPTQSVQGNLSAGMEVLYTTPQYKSSYIEFWWSPYRQEYAAVGFNMQLSTAGNPSLQGKFRISRLGSTYSSFYWNGTGWTKLWTEEGPPDVPVKIRPFAAAYPNSPAQEVFFDNFSVTTHTYPASGTVRLKHDGGRSGKWNDLKFSADIPDGTSIKFRTRTADTESGLDNAIWSDYLTASGSAITSPDGRWIEVEATLATTNTRATPVLHDLTVTQSYNTGDILWQADVPVNLAQNAVAELNKTIGTLGMLGKLYFQGTLKSSTGQTVATAEYPFYVEQGNIQLLLAPDKKVYRPGETVTINGEVKNLSSVAAAGLALQVKGTETGGGTLYTENFDLPANGGHPFSFTTMAGNDGVYGLSGTVTQNAAALADIADQYEVANPAVTATLAAPDTAGIDPFVVTLSLNNSGKVNAATSVLVADNNGEIDRQEITMPAGETRLLQYTRQITGATTYTATFSGDLNQTVTKTVAYAPTYLERSLDISAKIVTDRISYNPNEQVTLTSTITANSSKENLSARIMVTNSQGQGLYSTTAAMPTLIQGQAVTINKYWNTGTNPAGTYLVTLQVLDAAGAVVAKSTCDLVISSTTKPTALLKGEMSLDKQSILSGGPVTVSYKVTNVGNADLSKVALSVQTVHMIDETVYNSIADEATLPMGGTYAKSGVIDTQGYSARDYLVVLRANMAGVEETLAGTYFRVEGAPSAPALSGPANGSDVETFTPKLSVSNASDPNDDKLAYEFEIYADSSLTNLVTSGTVSETAGITAWTVPVQLTENATCYWRARAYDGKLYGPWMAPATFRVNTFNDPPSAPAISSPADGTDVSVLTPMLAINNSTDPDSATLTYNFDVALDPDFNLVAASVKGIAGGEGVTSWTVPENLQENGLYYWRAQADDWLTEGPWSTTARFFVNTANDPPSAPVVTAPGNGSTVPALETDIVVSNAKDPDSAPLSYYFEADTVPSFDSPNILRSGTMAGGEGSTTWHVAGLLDNTRYFVRVKASDGTAESAWSPVTEFFANTANDPPTTPTLANPSNGAGVNVFTPTLSVHNATDLDHDTITYEFEVYADAEKTNLIAHLPGIAETGEITSWTVPVTLAENQTYYWQARAYDGVLHGDWMPAASFMVNTANDAPGAPRLSSPAEGSSVATLTPTLAVVNAVDPDSDNLNYEFEIYSGASLVAATSSIPGDSSGVTAWTPGTPLADNTVYQWRARAYDGNGYGPWTATATFTVHVPKTSINATIDFDPDTLNRSSNGTWVVVYIELPDGYKPADVDVPSIRLEGTIPAEMRPYAIGDHDKDGIPDLMVKFKRSDVINLLHDGDSVTVHVTGKVGATPFEGVDVIRVN